VAVIHEIVSTLSVPAIEQPGWDDQVSSSPYATVFAQICAATQPEETSQQTVASCRMEPCMQDHLVKESRLGLSTIIHSSKILNELRTCVECRLDGA